MRYLSICSGIESASVAWAPLGWSPVAFSEIDAFPSAVLAHHYPDVPNLGDMTRFAEWPESVFADADVVVGGCPCQAFSVAGLRGGVSDARGNLTLVFIQLVDHADEVRRKHGKPPVIIVYENVPGLLSSRDNAFGCLLGGLAGEDEALVAPGKRWTDAGCVLGPQRAIAYRVLDAQYFRLAQRRRRVFVVAGAGDVSPADILFEREGLRRDTPPSRGAEQVAASDARSGAASASHWDHPRFPHPTLSQSNNTGGLGGSNQELFSQRGAGLVPHPPIADGGRDYVAFGGNNTGGPIDVATARNACSSPSGRMDFETETFLVEPVHLGVRRITPEESEALQGFARNYTRIPWGRKIAADCPDGHRQKSLGNSMAVPCMAWLGRRIQQEVDRSADHQRPAQGNH